MEGATEIRNQETRDPGETLGAEESERERDRDQEDLNAARAARELKGEELARRRTPELGALERRSRVRLGYASTAVLEILFRCAGRARRGLLPSGRRVQPC